MMVDVLVGLLLGLFFGKYVSFMYVDLMEKWNLGQMFLVIDLSCFIDFE